MWVSPGQTNPATVVEAIDPAQDVRLRLIVAVLILLFCIAVVLIVAVVLKNRHHTAKAAPSIPPSKIPSVPPAPSQVISSEKQASEKAPTKAPEPLGASRTKPSEPQFPPAISNEHKASPSTLPAPYSVKKNELNTHTFGQSSKTFKKPFDLKAYKEELAGMDPEKKRQEILKRLEEIKGDKNAAGRSQIQLPKIMPAARPGVPDPQALNTSPPRTAPAKQERPFIAPPEDTEEKVIVQKPSSIQTPSYDESASSLPEESGVTATGPQNLPETSFTAQTGIPAGVQVVPEKPTEAGEEDFSYLSSIQRRRNRSSPRKSFGEWMEEVEPKDHPSAP